MRRLTLRVALVLLLVWLVASLGVGLWLLPGMLLNPPVPQRTEGDRARILRDLMGPGDQLDRPQVAVGEGRRLDLVHLRRPHPRGAVIYLHGFGDDLWGTLGRARALPDWDAVGFTFRGRDRDASVPCTLGGWERADVVAAFHYLEGQGFPPDHILLAGWSMGAGIGLLAMEDLEGQGKRVGGALLECPFEDLARAAQDHIRGVLGPMEPIARLAERVAIWQAGRQAHFDPNQVSPVRAAARLKGPIALVTGDADRETPVEGVRHIARTHPDLTIVPGAGHCEASNQLPGGWEGWARQRLGAWGFPDSAPR